MKGYIAHIKIEKTQVSGTYLMTKCPLNLYKILFLLCSRLYQYLIK